AYFVEGVLSWPKGGGQSNISVPVTDSMFCICSGRSHLLQCAHRCRCAESNADLFRRTGMESERYGTSNRSGGCFHGPPVPRESWVCLYFRVTRGRAVDARRSPGNELVGDGLPSQARRWFSSALVHAHSRSGSLRARHACLGPRVVGRRASTTGRRGPLL